MRPGRFRFGLRQITLAVAAGALLVAVLIVWLGYRYDLETDRIVAEGRLAQGEYLYREYGSCSDDGCDSDWIHVTYRVAGVTYRTQMVVSSSMRSGPTFEAEQIRVPRLGRERPFEVTNLPSDPSRSRLRADLSHSDIAVYGTAGMFLFAGLVFGAAGLFLLREPGRKAKP